AAAGGASSDGGEASGSGSGGNDGGIGASSSAAAAAGSEAAKKRKRAALTKEERAKQNRDRNREHARNTRLRKKAYVEELKKQVEELFVAKQHVDQERRTEQRRTAAIKETRCQV
ncbi:unnamed protein product, partial [Phaeothamnion confervicola]